MKLRTKEEVIATLKAIFEDNALIETSLISMPWGTSLLDDRSLNYLLSYFTREEAADAFGDIVLAAGWVKWHEVKPWDEQTIMEHISSSLKFAFKKARDRCNTSAALMHGVMRMWMWIIQDEELAEDDPWYDDYGLSCFCKIRDRYFPEMRPQG